jgi:hypothetical protein
MFSHSFKLLPNIGIHIVELIEGRLPDDLSYAWRWRPGGDALKSRRAAPAKDLADMPGWQHEGPVSQPEEPSAAQAITASLESVRISSRL